jgi:hypothetical protein
MTEIEEVENWACLYPENSCYHKYFKGIAHEMKKEQSIRETRELLKHIEEAGEEKK